VLFVSKNRSNARRENPYSLNPVNQSLDSLLGIHSNHFVHIGRMLGSFASKINEDDSEDLRRLGNWDPEIQEARYSITKLPMKIIRSHAGLQKTNDGLHYNPRVSLIPSENLQEQIFPWLDEAKEKFYSNLLHRHEPIAHHFLDFMSKLRIIILQDAAAMIAEKLECAAHPIFQFAVFNTGACICGLLSRYEKTFIGKYISD
jgi:hypothetical protein